MASQIDNPPTPRTKVSISPTTGSSRRVVISILLSLLSLSVGWGAYRFLASLKTPPKSRAVIEKTYVVEVYDTERTNLQEIISSFGTAHADREVVIAAQVSGEIVEIHPHLRIGHRVSASKVRVGPSGQSERTPGDLIVLVDPKTYQERSQQAEDHLAEDDAERDRLKQEEKNNARRLLKAAEDRETFSREYERTKKLRESNAVSASQLDQARLELRKYEDIAIDYENKKKLFPLRYEQINTRRQTHQTDLEIARLNLKHTEVRPPFDGTLSEVMIEEGRYVRAGDPLVRLTDLAIVEVPVPLTLADHARISALLRSGRRPLVRLAENETAPVRRFGRVVRAAPTADESTRTAKVYVEIDNNLDELLPGEEPVLVLPGMFLHARIDGPILVNILAVPRDAIINNKLFVVKPDGRVEERDVKIARMLQSLALIESGIQAGEHVILTNLDVIFDGAKVDIQSHHSLADELSNQRTQIARPVKAGSGNDENKADPFE